MHRYAMRRTMRSVLVPVLVLIWALGLVSGHPFFHGGDDIFVRDSTNIGNVSQANTGSVRENELRRRQSKVLLRILPLGASIVSGWGSSDGNGFRKPLRDALRNAGYEVNMVGSLHGGTMIDNNHEGTPGAVVTEMREYLKRSMGYKPNVVVINCGTNDAQRNIDPGGAGERMRTVLKDIWAGLDMENTCIMLSTVLPTTHAEGVKHRITVNRKYRDLATEYWEAGKCIYLAEMDPEGSGNGWISLNGDMDADGIHPNDSGHRKMAGVFYKSIMAAANSGYIPTPAKMEETGDEGCDKTPGNGKWSGGLTQQGSGIDDGIYYHDSEAKDIILTVDSAWDRNQWRFARLYGRKYDDFVGWIEKEPGQHRFGVWKNEGNGKFNNLADDMNGNIYCIPRGLHFADMNADGYDDIVCITPAGDLQVSINNKDGTSTKPPTFRNLGQVKKTEGWAQDRVRLADIDGDGRTDYCILDDGGNVRCWRNGGTKDAPEYWQYLGTRFTAKGMGDMRGVRFADINGDGRDDWLWVSDTGETTTWTNARSCQKGQLGDGLNVAWRQGFWKGKSSGATHAGVGQYGTGLRDRVHFARVYGEPQDFGLLGRLDYVFLQHEELDNGNHRFKMRVWKNEGYGGTKLKADGVKYCNMLGHEDGRMDYVWTLSKGEMRVYYNQGLTDVSGDKSFWGANEVIWEPRKYVGKDLDRRDLHLMDWDGDGTCDIVWVDPNGDNRPSVWLNLYPYTGKWDWTPHLNPESAKGIKCTQQRGLGIHDLSVRFADLDGNGRDDYLCIEPNGRVTGWVHKADNSWEAVGQIKFPEGADRANLRFADVNGDGTADMLWVDKFNGNARVFYNRGRGNPAELSGSSFKWDRPSEAFEGSYAGTCQYFPDLDGNNRADLHSIMGTFTNKAETWFSPDCGLTDRQGDDPSGNPNLPDPPWNTNPDDNTGGPDNPGDPNNPNDPQPYDPDPVDDNNWGPCTASYDNLDDIERDAAKIEKHCGVWYVLEIFSTKLTAAQQRYDEIMRDGYDGYFDTYADYIVDMAPDAMRQFLKDRGKEFFDCDIMERIECCRSCEFEHRDCQWCTEANCDLIDSPWESDPGVTWEKRAEACPPDYSQRGIGEDWEFTTYWKLRKADEDKFYDAVLGDVGVDKDKIKFGEWSQLLDHTLSPACAREQASGQMSDYCYYTGFWNGAPYVADFGKGDVINPKDTINSAMASIEGLRFNLTIVLMQVMSGYYVEEGFLPDIINSVSLPVFMMEDAVTNMEEVVRMAKEIKQDEIKFLVLNLLSGILFVLPFLGQGLAGLGMAQLGRWITVLAEVGNTALALESVVSDPSTAPLLIFSLVMSGRSIRDANRLSRAARIRAGMKDGDIEAFSKFINVKMNKVHSVVRKDEKPFICNVRYA